MDQISWPFLTFSWVSWKNWPLSRGYFGSWRHSLVAVVERFKQEWPLYGHCPAGQKSSPCREVAACKESSVQIPWGYSGLGDSRKYPYHTTDGFKDFRRGGGIHDYGILKAWGGSTFWNFRRQGGVKTWKPSVVGYGYFLELPILLLRQWILFLNCPTGNSSFLRNSINRRTVKSILLIKTSGLVYASPSLPEWQGVKITFFVTW